MAFYWTAGIKGLIRVNKPLVKILLSFRCLHQTDKIMVKVIYKCSKAKRCIQDVVTISNGVFLQKYLTAKSSTTDVQQGPKWYQNYQVFKLTNTNTRTTSMICRNSQRRCSIKKGAVGNFAKFTGKHQRQSLLFNKVEDLRPATLLKKWLWRRCFPVSFCQIFRNIFFTEHLQTTAFGYHSVSSAFTFEHISGIYSCISFINFELFLSFWYSL